MDKTIQHDKTNQYDKTIQYDEKKTFVLTKDKESDLESFIRNEMSKKIPARQHYFDTFKI